MQLLHSLQWISFALPVQSMRMMNTTRMWWRLRRLLAVTSMHMYISGRTI